MSGIRTLFKNLFTSRDELTIRNIRWCSMWPLIFIFPLSVITGQARFFNLGIEFMGKQSYELMMYPLGLGWLVLVFTPEKFISIFIRIAAACSLLLIPFQLYFTDDLARLSVFMAYQFFNGICAASAFYIFCFKLNNIERLFGMMLIILFYGFWYTIWRTFPAVQYIGKLYGGFIVVAFYIAVVYLSVYKITRGGVFSAQCTINNVQCNLNPPNNSQVKSAFKNSDSGAKFVIGLYVIYYTIMCSINYIEWAEGTVSSMAFGLGQYAAVIVILVFHLLTNFSALHIWFMYLAFSLLGQGVLFYDSEAIRFAGSLVYGIGDGIGYIIIYYLCAGAIKKTNSINIYKLFCFTVFLGYCVISGIYSQAFGHYVGSNQSLAFGVVLVMCTGCFLLMPVLQKKLFEAPWTDALKLADMTEYAPKLAETNEINSREDLNLTERESEIFTLLLKGMAPKEIGFTLKISYHTIDFHRRNLYRKLGIQSRAELFAKYGKSRK